jgi:hypothetical protein
VRHRGTAFGLMAAALALAAAAPASAALPVNKYVAVKQTFAIPAKPSSMAPTGTAGGSVSCPAGTKVITGGAEIHRPGEGLEPPMILAWRVSDSGPSADNQSWYADGTNTTTSPLRLVVEALCLKDKFVEGYSVTTSDSPLSGGQFGGGYVTCANASDRVVTGGAIFHAPAAPPNPDDAASAHIEGSAPGFNRDGYYGDGGAPAPSTLSVSAHCLPKATVGNYTLEQKTLKIKIGHVNGAYVDCPPGTYVVTGGAFFHAQDMGPMPDDANGRALGANVPTGGTDLAHPTRWYAAGQNLGTDTSYLTIEARCLPA